MRNIVFTFFISLFIIQFAFAKKLKVTKAELEEEYYSTDKSVPAAILEETIDVTYVYDKNDGFLINRKVYNRIKIYNKKGLDYAIQNIRLWKTKTAEETVEKLKAKTYKLLNGKIEEYSIKKEAVYKDETTPDRNIVKFTLPNVTKGSVIEFSYVVVSPYFTYFPNFYFQERIPIKSKKLNVEIPEYFDYRVQTRGGKNITLIKSKKRDKISFTQSKVDASGGLRRAATVEHINFDLDFITNIYSLNLQNVEAYKEESYVSNVYSYLPSVEFNLKSIKYPNSSIKYYSNTWEDVLKKKLKNSAFKDELSKTNYFKKDLQSILSKSTTEVSKIGNIFNFLKNKLSWNGVYSSSAYNGVRSAYKEEQGSVGQINTILLSMLREANITASPIFVSSIETPLSIYPSYTAFDYMIVEVTMTDNSKYYLDATDKASIPNILPERVIKGKGKLMTKSGKVVDIKLRPAQSLVNTVLACSINQEGIIEGKVKNRTKGYESYLYRKNTNKNEEDLIKKMKSDYNISEIAEYDRKGFSDLYADINYSYHFKMDEFSTLVDDEIYFQPLLFLQTTDNPFKIDERKFPVDLGNTINENCMIDITIPEGYIVTNLPENISLALPENIGEFNFSIVNISNKIQLRVSEKWNQPFIDVVSYPIIKEFIKKIIEKENEQIVLKKIK